MNYKCEICKDTGWVETNFRTYKKCSCVDKLRMENLWQEYGVNPKTVKKLNQYKVYDSLTDRAKSKALDYVLKYNERIFEENNWFAMMGQSGAGKSHIVIAIGAALLKKGHNVVYMPYTEAVKELKSCANDNLRYSKIANRYMKSEILVIDDLFKDKVKNGELIGDLTEVDIKHIYPILNTRYYNKLATIISTECSPEMLIKLDEALGGRIIERSLNFTSIFLGDRYNYRFKILG